jgi:hypothetical protein
LSRIGHYVACDVGLLTIRRPCLHQLAPLFQRVAAPVRLLGLVANRVRKGGLGNLARELGLVPRSIAKGRAEAMRREIASSHSPQRHQQRHV